MCAAFVAAIGVLFFLGVTLPFTTAGVFGSAITLREGNVPLVLAVVVAAVVCVGACVGEFVRLREALLTGVGMAAGVGLHAVATVVAVAFLAGYSGPSVGVVAWLLVALAAVVTSILAAMEVIGASDRTPAPVVFAACSLGGGLLVTLGRLLPPPGVAIGDHLAFSQPFLSVLILLGTAAPAAAGVAVMVARHRAMHIIGFGLAAWSVLSWAQQGINTRDGLGALGGGFHLTALALFVWGLAAVGGGLVRWNGSSPLFQSARDYALPISAVSVFLIVFLAGLTA